jgi:hypothetical protein
MVSSYRKTVRLSDLPPVRVREGRRRPERIVRAIKERITWAGDQLRPDDREILGMRHTDNLSL